jgi:hypothetical protein
MTTKFDEVLNRRKQGIVSEGKVKELSMTSDWRHFVFLLANKMTQIGTGIELKNLAMVPVMAGEVLDYIKEIAKLKIEGADNKTIKKTLKAVEATMKAIMKLKIEDLEDFKYVFKCEKDKECTVTDVYQNLVSAFDGTACKDKGKIERVKISLDD